MTPGSIKHLPVELHTSILKFLSDLCTITPDALFDSAIVEWTEQDVHSPSLFPFNAASVCKLWLSILARFPDCWTRVIFDVANDPTPFLDAFLWSQNLPLSKVVVFNSNDAQIVDKSRENSRVLAISHALQPHILRCRSIIFTVKYSTSLPPPTNFFFHEARGLDELVLYCCIDDVDLQSDAYANMMMQRDREEFATPPPHLHLLSLTGFWFMYLMLHVRDPEWLKHLEPMSFFISRFTFPKDGLYTLPMFAFYISMMKHDIELELHELSLSYIYDGLERGLDTSSRIQVLKLHFHSVSQDFLAHLYAITDIHPGLLSFEACEIPKLKQDQCGSDLELINILDDDKGTSICHILEGWTGSWLELHSCPSFNDAVLSWFAPQIEYVPRHGQEPNGSEPAFKSSPSSRVANLTIDRCDNFSSHALKEFVRLRNTAGNTRDGEMAMSTLDVIASRRGPTLEDEDREWYEENAEYTAVCWTMQDDQDGTVDVLNVGERGYIPEDVIVSML